jgi:hypothetical protein
LALVEGNLGLVVAELDDRFPVVDAPAIAIKAITPGTIKLEACAITSASAI